MKHFLLSSVVLFFSANASWAAETNAAYIEKELEGLRQQYAAQNISGQDLQRMAEIYFLTSRCDELKTLNKENPATTQYRVSCLCNFKLCKGEQPHAKVIRFRDLLDKPSVSAKEIADAWKNVKTNPEAKYFFLKFLRSNKNYPNATQLILDLEHELERF